MPAQKSTEVPYQVIDPGTITITSPQVEVQPMQSGSPASNKGENWNSGKSMNGEFTQANWKSNPMFQPYHNTGTDLPQYFTPDLLSSLQPMLSRVPWHVPQPDLVLSTQTSASSSALDASELTMRVAPRKRLFLRRNVLKSLKKILKHPGNFGQACPDSRSEFKSCPI